MSLKQTPREWAEAVHAAVLVSTSSTRAEAFRLLEASPFNISRAWRELEKYYLQLLGRHDDSQKFREEAAPV